MFKKGDKVRCVDDGDYRNLTEGKTYEITSVDDEGYISIIGDLGDYGEYWSSRFELVEEGTKMFKKGDKVKCIDASFRNLTEGDVYEVEVSEYKGANDDSFIQVKNDDGSVKEFWASRFELVEEEKKMYKEEDIYAGMKLECVSDGGYTHWTEGKVYEVDENFQIYSDGNSRRNTDTILQYLNEVDNDKVIFKVIDKKRYTTNARMEIVSTPEPVESEEITLTIKGKTFYDIRSEADELLKLVNSIIEASEELGISEEKVKRIYGGAK